MRRQVVSRAVNWSGIIVWIMAFMGCSNGSTATYPVTGTVKFADGKPLAGGRILFQPVGADGRFARSIIGDNGGFELGTYHSNDGAVAGKHKIMITPMIPEHAAENPAESERYRSVIDVRYQNVQTTPLELTVKDDGSENTFEIVLKSSKVVGAVRNQR